MTKESDLQSTIIKWLRGHGAIAIKYQQNATTRAAIPDIIALKEGLWLAIEVKKTKTSPFRPGQKEMVAKLNDWSYARIVWGGKNSNWPEVQKELGELLK